MAGDDYTRQVEDDRFVDYIGAVQSIVTSSAQSDSGMFETNLRDDRFLPFEGAGADSTWKLDLLMPRDYPAFDPSTVSDVIFHIRHTARPGVPPAKVKAALDDLLTDVKKSNLTLLLSLRHDFPTEWTAFVNGTGNLAGTIRKDYFPYFTQQQQIRITGLELYDQDVMKHHAVGDGSLWDSATSDLGNKDKQAFSVSIAPDNPGPMQVLTRVPDAEVFLVVRYQLGG
jgi:hypothetical protein